MLIIGEIEDSSFLINRMKIMDSILKISDKSPGLVIVLQALYVTACTISLLAQIDCITTTMETASTKNTRTSQ
jgi:hypothetical protein